MTTVGARDVVVVGAGPAGLALACALADAGITSHVLEQAPLESLIAPSEDGRDIALTHRSRRILAELGLWSSLPVDEIAPLEKALVVNGDSPLVLPFDAREEGHDALGWLVPNHLIRRAAFGGATARSDRVRLTGEARVSGLSRDADSVTVHLADGRAFSAPLVVAADSRFSTVRRMAGIGARMLDFGRSAVVCRMGHEVAHDNAAHECFLHGHTLAILPMAGKQVSAVWTVASDGVETVMAMSDDEFARAVASAFGHKLGTMFVAGTRHVYPLVAVFADRFCGDRFALIGDAAVGMHPVTAHGYNFGLYGIEVLARELAEAVRRSGDPGSRAALDAYAREHRRTTLPIFLGTNAIVKLFTTETTPARVARDAVLRVACHLPPVRSGIVRELTGNGSALPGRLLDRLSRLAEVLPLPPLPGPR